MSTTPAQETEVHLTKDTCPPEENRAPKPRRQRRADIYQPNTADVPKIEVGVATGKEHMVSKVFGELGAAQQLSGEKSLCRLLFNRPSLCF